MAAFYNQATLSFNGNVLSSNITAGEIIGILSAYKDAIIPTYSPDSDNVYVINMVNSGSEDLTNLTVTSDLGAYTAGEAPSPAAQEASKGDGGQRAQTDDGGTEQVPSAESVDSSGQGKPSGIRQAEAFDNQPEVPGNGGAPAVQPQTPSVPSQQQGEGDIGR